MPCSFCSKAEPVRIEINSINLRICPNCLATFLPAGQFAELRRETSDATKGAWRRKLLQKPVEGSYEGLCCMEHGTPLVAGTIPNYSFEGLVPTCCDLQHLPPATMAKILELGIGTQIVSSKRKSKTNGISRFLGGIIFYFWEKKQKNFDDGLDRLQYGFKFKDVLGDWVPE